MFDTSSLARQLEKATETVTRIATVAAATENTATIGFSKLAAPHCLPHTRSVLRRREAAGRPGRHRRLRAHNETRSQMPIPRPVNSRGIRSMRHIMNYDIDRIDAFREIPRNGARTPQEKIGILDLGGKTQRWLLGDITRSAPRRATRPGHGLRMAIISWVSPLSFFCWKKNSLKPLNAFAESDSAGMDASTASYTHRRGGTAIAPSYTCWQLTLDVRVRRPANRVSAVLSRHCQSRRQRLQLWRQHIGFTRSCSGVVCDIVTCFSVFLEAPAALADALAQPSLDSYRFRFDSRRPPYFERNACWATGERASDAPGLPAASPSHQPEGQIQDFATWCDARIWAQYCRRYGNTHSLMEAGQFQPAEHVPSTLLTDPADAAPDSPVALTCGGSLDQPQHCPYGYLITTRRTPYFERNACWATGGRASDAPGLPAASPSHQSEVQVQDLATWCEGRDLVQLWSRYDNAYSLMQANQFQWAEQLLLTFLKDLAQVDAVSVSGLHVVQHSLRTFSSVLITTTGELLAQALRATASVEHGIASMESLTIQPMILLSTVAQKPNESARQSVGSHGDNT